MWLLICGCICAFRFTSAHLISCLWLEFVCLVGSWFVRGNELFSLVCTLLGFCFECCLCLLFDCFAFKVWSVLDFDFMSLVWSCEFACLTLVFGFVLFGFW